MVFHPGCKYQAGEVESVQHSTFNSNEVVEQSEDRHTSLRTHLDQEPDCLLHVGYMQKTRTSAHSRIFWKQRILHKNRLLRHPLLATTFCRLCRHLCDEGFELRKLRLITRIHMCHFAKTYPLFSATLWLIFLLETPTNNPQFYFFGVKRLSRLFLECGLSICTARTVITYAS